MNLYKELNQIFYSNNKFDVPEDLKKLEPYFYIMETMGKKSPSPSLSFPPLVTNSHITEPKGCNENWFEKEKEKEILPTLYVKYNWFDPIQKDSIFWCIYTFIHGYDEYLMIGSRYGNKELEEKQKMYDQFKKFPKSLKTTNIKITNVAIEEIFSEFLCMTGKSSYLILVSMAVYYQINIVLVDENKKIFLPIKSENATKTCILYKHPKMNNKYKMKLPEEENSLEHLKTTMVCLENFIKPLLSVSNYKVDDLKNIAEKIGLKNYTSLKKQELYKSIEEYCVWLL